MLKKIRSLELDQDMSFQKKWWKGEKIAWALMILIVIAALLGLTGEGLLSRSIAGNKNGRMWIEFHRFLRSKSTSTIHIYINESGNNNKMQLMINRDYLKNVRIEQVMPPPEEVKTNTGYIIYKFNKTEGNNNQFITLYIKPQSYGSHKAVFKLQDSTIFLLSQFVYP